MKVDITARHFSLSVQLKEMVYEKLKKIEKFNRSIMNCRVILTKEANFEDVEIVVNSKGHHFVANENSDNFVFDNEMLVQAIYFGYRVGRSLVRPNISRMPPQ